MCFLWKGSRKPLFDLIPGGIWIQNHNFHSFLFACAICISNSPSPSLPYAFPSLTLPLKPFRYFSLISCLIQVQMLSHPPTFIPLASVHLYIDIHTFVHTHTIVHIGLFLFCLTRLSDSPRIFPVSTVSFPSFSLFSLDLVAYPCNISLNLDTVALVVICIKSNTWSWSYRLYSLTEAFTHECPSIVVCIN